MLPYPDDGGLKPQARDPKEALSAFTVVLEAAKRGELSFVMAKPGIGKAVYGGKSDVKPDS